MARILTLTQLGTYLTKQQGQMSESAFAAKLKVPRHTLRGIKDAKNRPRDPIIEQLGFEVVYRQK